MRVYRPVVYLLSLVTSFTGIGCGAGNKVIEKEKPGYIAGEDSSFVADTIKVNVDRSRVAAGIDTVVAGGAKSGTSKADTSRAETLRTRLPDATVNFFDELIRPKLPEAEVDSYLNAKGVGIFYIDNLAADNKLQGYRARIVSGIQNPGQLPALNALYGKKVGNIPMILYACGVPEDEMIPIVQGHLNRVSGRGVAAENIKPVKNLKGRTVAFQYTGKDRAGLDGILRQDSVGGVPYGGLIIIFDKDKHYLDIPFDCLEAQAYNARFGAQRAKLGQSLTDVLNYPFPLPISSPALLPDTTARVLGGAIPKTVPPKRRLKPLVKYVLLSAVGLGASYLAAGKAFGWRLPWERKEREPPRLPLEGTIIKKINGG